MKDYEADMRHLIDNYLQADEPRKISEFESLSLLKLLRRLVWIRRRKLYQDSIKKNEEAMAETIENNVRTKIVREHLNDPVFFEENELAAFRNHQAKKGKGRFNTKST
ncbi:MAG: hypothetical protein WDN75_14560 [Bacteroidota bacterium]